MQTENEERGDLVPEDVASREGLDVVRNSRGDIVLATRRDVTLVAVLVERNVLEPHHFSYGLGLLELQHSFLSPLRHKANSIFLDQLFGGGVGSSDAIVIYQRVCRELRKDRVEAVIHACTHAAPMNERGVFLIHEPERWREIFNRLVGIMDDVRQQMQEEREAEARLTDKPLSRSP